MGDGVLLTLLTLVLGVDVINPINIPLLDGVVLGGSAFAILQVLFVRWFGAQVPRMTTALKGWKSWQLFLLIGAVLGLDLALTAIPDWPLLNDDIVIFLALGLPVLELVRRGRVRWPALNQAVTWFEGLPERHALVQFLLETITGRKWHLPATPPSSFQPASPAAEGASEQEPVLVTIDASG